MHHKHVITPMTINEGPFRLLHPNLGDSGQDDVAPVYQLFHTLPTL